MCTSEAIADATASYALSCKRCAISHNHLDLNDIIRRFLNRARSGLPASTEAVSPLRTDGNKPDGIALL